MPLYSPRLRPLAFFLLVFAGCQQKPSAVFVAEEPEKPAPLDSVWTEAAPVLRPVSQSFIADMASLLGRVDSLAINLANARAADCFGPSPSILPVINSMLAKLDTVNSLRPFFKRIPPNLTPGAEDKWDQAGQAIELLFPDGRSLLQVSLVRPLSEPLIRSLGLSLHARALEARASLFQSQSGVLAPPTLDTQPY